MIAARGEAPGRVNLIGEHTDHERGLVLPAAIPLRTRVELTPREGDLVSVRSDALGAREYRLGVERRTGEWHDHFMGVTAALRETGHELRAFEARISSDVPIGAGLASSAALSVALVRALRDALSLPLDDRSLALLAHRGETDLVGAQVGLMDQLVASEGRDGEALRIDLVDLSLERIPLPAALELVVIDSGITHANRSGGYAVRRRECVRARELLGLGSLREATAADAERLAASDPALARRVRHVVSENARVVEATAALRAGDLARLGALVTRSHASLRDDFAVSLPEIDELVRLLAGRPGVHGARLVGGGFGGAVLGIAGRGAGAAAARDAARAYARSTGRQARVLLPAA